MCGYPVPDSGAFSRNFVPDRIPGFFAPESGILKTLYLRLKTRFDETFCHHKITPPPIVIIIFLSVKKDVKSSEFFKINPKITKVKKKLIIDQVSS